jgi:hypothetical protein
LLGLAEATEQPAGSGWLPQTEAVPGFAPLTNSFRAEFMSFLLQLMLFVGNPSNPDASFVPQTAPNSLRTFRFGKTIAFLSQRLLKWCKKARS